MRKLIAVAVVFAIGLGIAMAEDVRGIVKSVDGDKLVITKMAKKGEKGDDVTYVVPTTAKIVAGKRNPDTKKTEAGDALDGGLKNEAVKAGAFVTVTVDGDKVSQVMVGGGGKGKGKKTQ
jgi:hypothetical protein